MAPRRRINAVVMGASWGGLDAYTRILGKLPAQFPVPILLVQHQRVGTGDKLPWLLDTRTALRVLAPEDKTELEEGCIYVAPPGYHMLVGRDHCISFSMSPPVHYCRPAIDELFFSAADVYGSGLLGVILTGANEDGAEGVRHIKRRGGVTLAQSPASAEAAAMPQSAIETGAIEHIVDLDDIGDFVTELTFGLQE